MSRPPSWIYTKVNLYSRRDWLELHGIPVQSGEDTDKLVQKVGELVGTK